MGQAGAGLIPAPRMETSFPHDILLEGAPKRRALNFKKAAERNAA